MSAPGTSAPGTFAPQSRLPVAVLGTGLMGPSIAAAFAAAGHVVWLASRSEAGYRRGLAAATAALAFLAGEELLDAREAEDASARVRGTADLATAVAGADLVVEAVAEDLAVKRPLLQAVETRCSARTILASSTSGLPVAHIGEGLARPECFLAAHFWNPPHLMPLVEVVPGSRTDPSVVRTVLEMLRGMGKTPVLLRKDVPGHIANRLQYAVFREAFHLIETGVATAEDIDCAMKNGPGLRYPVYGPLEHVDAVGLALTETISGYLFPDLGDARTPPPVLKRYLADGRTGATSGRGFHDWTERDLPAVIAARDRFLAARLRARRRGEEPS